MANGLTIPPYDEKAVLSLSTQGSKKRISDCPNEIEILYRSRGLRFICIAFLKKKFLGRSYYEGCKLINNCSFYPLQTRK